MPRRLRFVPLGSLIEVTGKTFQDRYLLKPSKELNRRVIGVFARAKVRYGVKVHALTVLSNHYHCLLSPVDADRLAGFMNYVHSNVAHEVGRLHDWDGRFWKDRYKSIPVSDEEAAQVARLRYLLANGCKDGLVAKPGNWPGVHSADALTDNENLEGVWYDRTSLSRARARGESVDETDFATTLVLRLDPLPCWQERGLSREARRQEVSALIRSIVEDAAVERRASGAQEPKPVRFDTIHPHQRAARSSRRHAPLVHAGSREVRNALRLAYRSFVESFYSAKRRLDEEGARVRFPEGSFPPSLPFVPYGLKPAPS